MKNAKSPPGAATASLMHWLALVSGLAVLSLERADVPAKVVPMWVGGVLGTAFGAMLAKRRLRLWLALVILANTMFFGALLSAPLWLPYGRVSGDALELGMLSFAPAVVSAYLALGDRSTLAGLWFPVVLWTLAVLDHTRSPGGDRLLLLAGPVMMILGGFYAHESRRVALWGSARPTERRTLLEAPMAALGRGVWTLGVAALALAITAWIAPRLWQREEKPGAHVATAGVGAGDPGDLPCCPEITPAPVEQVREYFSPLAAHARPASPFDAECRACAERSASTSGPTAPSVKGAPEAPGANGTFEHGLTGRYGNGDAMGERPASPITEPTRLAPDLSADPAPIPRGVNPAEQARVDAMNAERADRRVPAPAAKPLARPSSIASEATLGSAGGSPHASFMGQGSSASDPAAPGRNPIPWLLTLVVVGAAVQLVSRPLRRALAIRHLREPIWPEPIDQRISNLWQLALVGLRDRGFLTVPGEAPHAIARRSGLADMATCATVLERARHGVRLDAGDVDAMKSSAAAAYARARKDAGVTGRALGQLRWPLL